MKFFLDHDVPNDVGRVLRLKGHEVQTLNELLPIEIGDLPLLRYAVGRDMVIITCNRGDFLRLAQSEPHRGIIILIRRRTRLAECAAVLRLIARASEQGIVNNINFA